MKPPVLACILVLGSADAALGQAVPRWYSEPRPPNPSYDRPSYHQYRLPRTSHHGPRWEGQRWPFWRPGERGQYDASTVATYPMRQPAPGNDCLRAAFEVLNARFHEARCVAIDHDRP